MKAVRIDVTSDSDGDSTDYSAAIGGGGIVYAVQCVDGDFDDGVDLTLTAETGEVSINILAAANFNSDRIYYPRVLENLDTDASALTTHTYPLAVGRLKSVIASAGDTKTGAIVVYISEI